MKSWVLGYIEGRRKRVEEFFHNSGSAGKDRPGAGETGLLVCALWEEWHQEPIKRKSEN